MVKDFQKTLKETAQLEGVGLHNGIKVNISLKPAEVNSGIKFKRTDVDSEKNIIEANYENVKSPVLCTKIENQDKISVSTIEHLLNCLMALPSRRHPPLVMLAVRKPCLFWC